MTRLFWVLAIVVASGTAILGDQSMSVDERLRLIEERLLRDQVLDAIATAADLPVLKSAVLSPGYREIRVRTEQPTICCYASPMLRLVEGPDDVRGSLWLFRTLSLRSPGHQPPSHLWGPRDDERCAPLAERQVCVRPWTLRSGDWAAVRGKLEELGAWTLDRPCNRPKIVNGLLQVSGRPIDNGALFVQRRLGSRMTAFDCYGPQEEREPDGLKANALYEYLKGLPMPIPAEALQGAR
jgi:hypothetical protein